MLGFSKSRQMNKISKDGKFLFLALDHGLEHGPTDFDEKTIDPAHIITLATKMRITGLILQKGLAIKYRDLYFRKVPLILKLNGKTSLTNAEPYSGQIASVNDAVELGADAVGYTIYIGSKMESAMLETAGKIESEARKRGLPLIIWAYPRGKYMRKKDDPQKIAYAARVALEIGADIVKVHYTGRQSTFAHVVASAGECKVISAGGPKEHVRKFYKDAENIMAAGAAGMAVGRNVWGHDDPVGIANSIAAIIFGKEEKKPLF